MCGRFSLRTPSEDLVKFFQLAQRPDWMPRFNIAPTQPVLAVRQTPVGREPSLLHWGLIPSWSKDPHIGARMINARSETITQKPSFRTAFCRRRCLILADGFYEWKKLSSKTKQPFFISRKDEKPFALAGLWDYWEGVDGSAIESCTIITAQANELLAEIHDRMPVIVPSENHDVWLDTNCRTSATPERLLALSDASEWVHYPVSTFVNSPRNDSVQCIAPVEAVE